jgi:UDP-N-acetylmuramate dehydrogenase
MQPSVLENVSLKSFNTFGVEARAAFVVRITHWEQLAQLDEPRLRDMPRLILGGGSNVLLTRDFDGVVVKLELRGCEEMETAGGDWLLRVGAGENWHATIENLLAMQRPGLENLALIPGTVGAAPVQNIGAYGLELAERFHSLRAWDFAGQRLVEMLPADCDFGYRDSVFKHPAAGSRAIVDVTLALPRTWEPLTGYTELEQELKSRGVVEPGPRDVFDAVVAIRRRKLPDPAQIGNAGSFFKNPIVTRGKQQELLQHFPSLVSYPMGGGRFKLAAGWLIEAAGMKGATRGRAGVYEKQALVLVNRGGATGAEILALAREVQDKVAAQFGVTLEPELVIV